jgi:hypothetical protein
MRKKTWAVLFGLTLVAVMVLPAFAEKGVVWGN